MSPILLFFLLTLTPPDEESVLLRAQHHTLISNERQALLEIDHALKENSTSQRLLRAKLSVLAAMQDERCMLITWKQYQNLYPQLIDDKLLEEMSWATIKKSSRDSSPLIRMEADFAAFYAQDAKGIPLLEGLLSDQNMGMRLFGLYLISNLRDTVLEKKAIELLTSDGSQLITEAAISTLGQMRSQRARPYLMSMLEREDTPSELRYAIYKAICSIQSTIDRADLIALTQSKRAHLRALACEFVLLHHMQECTDLILPLINDPSQDVQIFAMQTIGALRPKIDQETEKRLVEIAESDSKELAISACYILLVTECAVEPTKKKLRHFLSHHDQNTRLFAAASITHAGSKSLDLAARSLHESDDPLVAMNLAIHLIKQRDTQSMPLATNALVEGLKKVKGRLDFCSKGLFTFVGVGSASHLANIPRYPEMKDLACRLQIYSILATCNTPYIEELLRQFLKERSWGITAMAAQLLMQEGGVEAMSIIKNLLSEETLEVRLQAAFLLAITTQDKDALATLESAFPNAPREFKEQILLGIGAIGSKTSLPFLCKALDEPSPILRIRAAGAILQCLYH